MHAAGYAQVDDLNVEAEQIKLRGDFAILSRSMGIFDRIRKIFSRSDSSSTSSDRLGHEPRIHKRERTTEFNHRVQRLYLPELNQDFNVSSNVLERPLTISPSSATLVTARTSNTSDTKLETLSAPISTTSENGKQTSTVEVYRISAPKYQVTTTSEATTPKEIATARNPVISKRTAVPMTHQLPLHNTTNAEVFSLKRNIPVISQQSATSKTSNATQTSNNTKVTDCIDSSVSSVTSHKIVNKAADHNRKIVGFASTQKSESVSKTGESSIIKASRFVSFETTQTAIPKTQTLSYSKASLFASPVTSHRLLSSTIQDQGRLPKYYESVSLSNKSTVPRTEHTYIGVLNKAEEPPRKNLKTKINLSAGFYPVVEGLCTCLYQQRLFIIRISKLPLPESVFFFWPV